MTIIVLPKTAEEAVDNLQTFFECDMWYASQHEWKTEDDMLRYLKGHFHILKNEIKALKNKKII